jgi:tripartite-type tricarboxylate transporter receptor subunit TctC
MISRRRAIGLAAAAALAGAPTSRAFAQSPAPPASASDWPNRFVRLIVPFPPGGGTDAIARVVAGKLSDIWGQQMVVENRGGGATNIGTEAVVRSDPDGYTMLITSMPLAVNRFLFPSLNYDPLEDLAPVSLICEYPNIMAVPITSPARSVGDFIAYAKANRGKVTFASSGHGTSVHLSGELFKRMAGIEMLHVPYRGAGPALNDLLPGRVDVMFNNIGAVLPLIRGGKLRGLAVTTAKRTPAAPELPPIAEAGVPGFDVSSWYALFAPARTAPEVVRKMHADIVAALSDPVTRERLEQLGVVVVGSTPAELATFLRAEMHKWGPVIKEAGISIRE